MKTLVTSAFATNASSNYAAARQRDIADMVVYDGRHELRPPATTAATTTAAATATGSNAAGTVDDSGCRRSRHHGWRLRVERHVYGERIGCGHLGDDGCIPVRIPA